MTSFLSSLFPSAAPPPPGAQIVAGFKCGWHEDIGRRPTLEDRVAVRAFTSKPFHKTKAAYFAVFDGHGGDACAAYLEKHLPARVEAALSKRAEECILASGKGCSSLQDAARCDAVVAAVLTACYEEADAQVCQRADGESGSTAATLLLLGQRLYCANVGDSRVVLCRAGQVFNLFSFLCVFFSTCAVWRLNYCLFSGVALLLHPA
jgi:serine/threonine protein phosphatase PrpC